MDALKLCLQQHCPTCQIEEGEQLSIIIRKEDVLSIADLLKTHHDFKMDMLLDLCVVDYLHYGLSEWDIQNATEHGYGRAQAEPMGSSSTWNGPRFVVVCHLLSLVNKIRLRLKVYLDDSLVMPSLVNIWPSSNWYEREAYDLFGIRFENHPDLRRILTDYGFIGFPFRKDFPLVGHVEMRYDGLSEKCIYEPVSIENRVGVPKVIREDHRYINTEIES